MFYCVTDFYRGDIILDELLETLTYPSKLDIELIRKLAKSHPDIQPFSSDELDQILRMVVEIYTDRSLERIFVDVYPVSIQNSAKLSVGSSGLLRMTTIREFPHKELLIAIKNYWYMFRKSA